MGRLSRFRTRFRSFAGALLGAALLFSGSGCDEAALEEACQKVVFDYRAHAFTVERRYSVDDGVRQYHWLERVKSNGKGRFEVELLERNGLPRAALTDPREIESFDRLAAQLATGGGMRSLFQRDPGPDDLDRMAANYWISLVDLGREPITAKGEPSLTYLVEPIVDDRPFYALTVSTRRGREGFPLECQEYVKEGTGSRLVSNMVVTSLVWGVPAEFAPIESPIVSTTALATLDEARTRASAANVVLLLPKDDSLPPGFVLARVEEVSMRSEANLARTEQVVKLWRFVYSDGVEHIDFIEHAPLDTMPQGYVAASHFDVAFVSRFGAISSASLLHGGTQVTIESRISADRFRSLLGSLVTL